MAAEPHVLTVSEVAAFMRVSREFELAVDIHDRKEHEALLEQARKTAESHARRATEAMDDVKRTNAVMTSRELRVLEMKEEVNDLLAELGRTRKYEHV